MSWENGSGGPPPKRGNKGFSLIEVVLSLAIVSSVLLGIIALLGQAVDITRVSATRTTSADIASRLVGELQLQEWAAITTPTPELLASRYFDQEGLELSGGGAQADSIYTARIILSSDGPALGTSASIGPNPHLRKALVIVARSPGTGGDAAIDRYRQDGTIAFNEELFLFHSVMTNLEKPAP